ncbi:hypothetical protein ILUMI_14845 [Ignelater luminosus]|uniref:Uncharacterized protein n=1 Tax=Ignelater luminosus TaxID=2038154 RepID=A0A8K0GAJ0_IGNLU|nr:hypothetical protein ILUMI_14845 [Ignelater luminosus]
MMKERRQYGAGRNPPEQIRKQGLKWEDINSAFHGRIRTGAIINLKHADPLTFLEDALPTFRIRIKNILKHYQLIKVNSVFCGLYEKETANSVIEEGKYFQTKNAVIDGETNLKEWWEELVQDDLIIQLEDFQERDSGWKFKSILNLAVNINRYEPVRGSSYIPLPPAIARNQAVINVKNDDDACFAWTVVSALHQPVDNPDRITSYSHYSTVLNLEKINFPMTIDKLKRFEKQNSISVNTFMLVKASNGSLKVVPARLTKQKMNRHVNLLIVQDTYDDDNAEEIKYHWCWIKNLSRLVSKQTFNKQHKVWICERCLYYFYSEDKLRKHEVDCSEINECRVRMPYKEKDKTIKFKNLSNALSVPFIIYADFESLLKPIKKQKGKNSELYQEIQVQESSGS